MRTLVLNAGYEPLAVVSFKRALILVLNNKATVLAQALVREGLRNVAAGADPISLKRGIEKAVEAVIAELFKQAKPVSSKEQIAATASISAGDSVIGEIIADAID
jgi:chaperonin GroEL